MSTSNVDKRRDKRKAFLKNAFLQLGEPSSLRKCIVLDISHGGARLSVDPAPLPDMFTLVLSPNGSVRRSCELAWRKEDEIGVRFVKKRTAS